MLATPHSDFQGHLGVQAAQSALGALPTAGLPPPGRPVSPPRMQQHPPQTLGALELDPHSPPPSLAPSPPSPSPQDTAHPSQGPAGERQRGRRKAAAQREASTGQGSACLCAPHSTPLFALTSNSMPVSLLQGRAVDVLVTPALTVQYVLGPRAQGQGPSSTGRPPWRAWS